MHPCTVAEGRLPGRAAKMTRLGARAAASLIILSLGGCSSRPSESHRFVMCDRDGLGIRVVLDKQTGLGLYHDIGGPVERCRSDSGRCFSFPFLFSIPPRTPAHAQDLVRWSDGEASFQMALVPFLTGARAYHILGRAGPQRFSYLYREGSGLERMQELPSPARFDRIEWVRCAGSLTWPDVRQILSLPTARGSPDHDP